jgi:hypothetical protein
MGPAGPTGPTGPAGGTSEFTYFGEMGQPCIHCHSTNVHTWATTGHAEAYTILGDSQGDPYCLQCHTTGFDSQVQEGDTQITDYGPDVNGYDDYFGIDTPEAAARRAALEGVQCESCHGPMGPDFNGHKPKLSFSTRFNPDGTSTSLCWPCHETQLTEWVTSGHSSRGGTIEDFNNEHYINNASCAPCHYSEGFIAANDPAFATYNFPVQKSFIGCPTCHDPHVGEDAGGNEEQLRNLNPVEVQYHPGYEPGDEGVPTMEGYGPGQICAQCHHARYDNDQVQSQIENGTAHFGPHHGPQMDMFIGSGCYEIAGFTYNRDHSHQTAVTEACVKCHMVRMAEIEGEDQQHAFHSFDPDPGNCEPCHSGLPDFNYHGVQTEIQGKMDQLAVLLGFTDADDFEANFDSQAAGVQVWQREAGYTLMFLWEDRSLGVHNPTYARSLLNNAIEYATEMGGLARK